jgi:hypothetical protein
MVRKVGDKNKQPTKDELRKLLNEKDKLIDTKDDDEEEINEPEVIKDDTVKEETIQSIFEDIPKLKEPSKRYDNELKEALGIEIEEEKEPEPFKEKTIDNKNSKELKRQIKEYYKEFSHKLTEKDVDYMNEDELKEELLSFKNLISKKNADSLVKYSIITLSGFIEYIGITRFDAPMQGYQKNISNNESLDDIIKEIKIKYGFNKLDNILSPEFRLIFLMVFTGYQTININKNMSEINNIKNKPADDVMNKYNDL